MGPRGGQNTYRDQNHRGNFRASNQDQPAEIDNWDPASTQVASETKGDETWGDCGDWDNEEYTGSLSDTKVFTPSGGPQSGGQDLAAPPGLEQQILNPPSQNDVTQYSVTVASSTATAGALNNGQYSDMHPAPNAAQTLRNALEMPMQSASLSAEQSQYFNTLGSQNSAAYASTVQYPYNEQVANQQAPRQQQQRPRARVPPPSKIPSTAVEMPGDGLNVYLGGVQFGELDFGTGTDESYETEKYDPSTGDDYASKGTGVSKGSQSSGLGGLQQSQLGADSISTAQGELSSGYAQRNPNVGSAGGQSALEQLTKPTDIYNHATGATAGGNAYQNLSYSSAQKSGYQAGYGTNAYNSTQSSNNYPASSNTYGYNQSSYQNQGTQSGTGQQQPQTTGASASSGAANQSNNSTG